MRPWVWTGWTFLWGFVLGVLIAHTTPWLYDVFIGRYALTRADLPILGNALLYTLIYFGARVWLKYGPR